MKTEYSKQLAALLMTAMLASPMFAQEPKPVSITIPQGTQITARLASELDSGRAKPGDLVTMDVLEDVKIGNLVAVPKGSIVMGHVTAAKGARLMGRGGKLDVTFQTVTAGDGTKVPISGEADAKGKGGYGGGSLVAAGAAGFFFPPAAALLLLKHGHASTIDVGAILMIHVTADTVVAGTVPTVAIAAPAPAPAPVVKEKVPQMVVVSAEPESESLGNYARRLQAEKNAKQ
jgi:hypothetical protein